MRAALHSNVEMLAWPARFEGAFVDAWNARDGRRLLATTERLRSAAVDARRTHNIMCDEGLDTAWPYLLGNGANQGTGMKYMELGSSGTAEAETDADLGTLLTQYSFPAAFRVGASAHFVIFLDTTRENGNTIREGGLRYDDNVAINGAVKDKFFGRFTHTAFAKTAAKIATWHWTVRVAGQAADNELWFDQGLGIVASKLVDPTEYGIIDRFAIGTGGTKPPDTQSDAGLVTEVYREQVTPTVGTAQISFSGTVLRASEYTGGGTIVEGGPATGGTTGAGQVAYEVANINMSANDLSYSVTLALANA